MGKEKDLIELLKAGRMTIATAESLTGGLIAAELISVPGASEVFVEGFVTYTDEAKKRTLGVPEDVIEHFGAVSELTAGLMADGAAKRAGTDVAIASTGVAGPDPSEGKPVGMVFISASVKGETKVLRLNLSGNRDEIRHMAADKAIALCIDCISGGAG